MLPPIKKADAETDKDSDVSDDMHNGLLYHLSRRLLNWICDSSLLDKGNKKKSLQPTQPQNGKSKKLAAREWKRGTDL